MYLKAQICRCFTLSTMKIYSVDVPGSISPRFEDQDANGTKRDLPIWTPMLPLRRPLQWRLNQNLPIPPPHHSQINMLNAVLLNVSIYAYFLRMNEELGVIRMLFSTPQFTSAWEDRMSTTQTTKQNKQDRVHQTVLEATHTFHHGICPGRICCCDDFNARKGKEKICLPRSSFRNLQTWPA